MKVVRKERVSEDGQEKCPCCDLSLIGDPLAQAG